MAPMTIWNETMHEKRVLVAGVGNIFHGDDAFGVFTIRELMAREFPEEVDVADFGLRTYDLAFAIMEGYEAVILVDAAARGGKPGSIYLLAPEVDAVEAGQAVASGHSMTPSTVLRMIDAFEGFRGRIVVVGCEPETLECTDGRIGLSEPVELAVQRAVTMVETLVKGFLASDSSHARLLQNGTVEAKPIERIWTV